VGANAVAPATRSAADFTCPATATGTSFAGKDLTSRNFHAYVDANGKDSLRGANFDGAKLRGAIFIGVDLTGASFRDADLGPSDKGPADFSNATLDHTCFIGATMNATIFTFSTMKCADFSGTSLVQADFGPLQYIEKGDDCRTRFVSATLDVHAIKISNPNRKKDDLASNWAKIDFTDANFLNLTPEKFSLAGKNITGAILAGTNFSGIDMRKANLTDVDFSRATLTKINADDATLNGAKFANAQARLASFRCARFYGRNSDNVDNPNANFCKANPLTTHPTGAADMTQATLAGAQFERATLNNAKFSGANLSNARLRYASLINASLQAANPVSAATVNNTNFTAANFRFAQLNGVHFNNDVMTGAIFDRTTLSSTQFFHSTLPDTSWDSATLEGVSFQNAALQNAKFTNTAMQTGPESTGVDFSCTQLGGASFANATISAAAFQDAVMPADADCCPQAVGPKWCGTIDATGENYGPVTFPQLQSSVTCPDGTVTQCQGENWRIKDWKTECNEAGELRVAWKKPCDVAPPGSVTFADKNLESCIIASLGATSISVATAAAMNEVSCAGKGVADLGGLENFTGLMTLDLTANRIATFDMPALTKVRTLKLSHNQLTTLDVSRMPNLNILEAAYNQLQSVPGLTILSPTDVDLSHNVLTALDLTGQSNLINIDLSHNHLTNVFSAVRSNLNQLQNLQSLNLASNQLATIGSLAALLPASGSSTGGNLQSLFLSCNPSFDCSKLQIGTTSSMFQNSGCAQFDVNAGWSSRTNPSCP
jgi:uncharacterized protein YjbI with pentapeptide repeats